MTSNKYPKGLPPQYPIRRGSNTPTSPLAAEPRAPNRSRSLDGLLDAEPPVEVESVPSKSCDELDKEPSVGNDVDSVSDASDKRKRNFMDRCVNKVRSFIKK